MVMARIAGANSDDACFDVLLDIDVSQDPAETIQKMAKSIKPLVGLSAEDSRIYVLEKLTEQFRLYQIRVPTYPDNEFAYYTGSPSTSARFDLLSHFHGRRNWADTIVTR